MARRLLRGCGSVDGEGVVAVDRAPWMSVAGYEVRAHRYPRQVPVPQDDSDRPDSKKEGGHVDSAWNKHHTH